MYIAVIQEYVQVSICSRNRKYNSKVDIDKLVNELKITPVIKMNL